MKRKCAVCGTEITITTQVFEGEEYEETDGILYSDDEGEAVFCMSCYEEILKGVNVDPLKILNDI